MRGKTLGAACCVVAIFALLIVPAASARGDKAAQTKRQAERNLLAVLARTWKHSRLPSLIDSQTGLLKSNVQVACHGRGRRFAGERRHSFTCIARPWPYTASAPVRIAYTALPGGHFHVRLLRPHRK